MTLSLLYPSPLLEEGGGSLLTHVVVRVPEVQPHLHVRLLLLGQGGEPLIAYPVLPLPLTSAWNGLTCRYR